MRSRVALLGAALLAGCEFDEIGIPPTDAQLALHGVLSATASTQVILLERTRNGSVFIVSPSFEFNDPIGSDQGIAESGATVQVTTPSGQVLFAPEDAAVRSDRKGVGLYRIPLNGAALQLNGTYRLRVVTAAGEVLTAETTVPAGVAAVSPVNRSFDRSTDTLRLDWTPVLGARSYFVRVETPYGPRSFFTDSTHVRLPGGLRNTDVTSLPRVFIPGFPQAVTVSAVDSNYYDWYRSQNGALTGTGLVNRVDGGLGFFGSLIRVQFEHLTVVTPQVEPVAGHYEFEGTAFERSTTPYLSLTLYVESKAARSDQADAISGRYSVRPRFGYDGCLTCGLMGTIRDGRVELSMLNNWTARDTVHLFSGELRGDTIVGNYSGFGGPVRFLKQH